MAGRMRRCSIRESERAASQQQQQQQQKQQQQRPNPADFSSIDDFFASYAYKPNPPNIPSQSSPNFNSKPNSNSNSDSNANTTGGKRERMNPPPQPGSSSSSFQPSSYVRVIVDGKERVVSSYFPLPQNASHPIVIDRRVIEKRVAKERKPTKEERAFLSYLNKVKKKKKNKKKMKEEEKEEDKMAENDHKEKKKRKSAARKQRSVLSSVEKQLDAYRRVGEESIWEAPKSEFGLLQERHCFDPWRVLVICMLLNMTTGLQVKRVLPGLFLRCPNAEAAIKINKDELADVIRPLGLYRKRAKAIIRFSSEYLGSEWTHVTQLHGVGKYAADAYAIFCAGKPEEVIPEDHKLVDYWKFVCEVRAQEQQQQSTAEGNNCSCN